MLGGTTAVSGGWAWIPLQPGRAPRRRGGLHGRSRDVSGTSWARPTRAHVEAYLKHGPEMVAFLEDATEVRFRVADVSRLPPEAPGAAIRRSIVAQPYDARLLGGRYQVAAPALAAKPRCLA